MDHAISNVVILLHAMELSSLYYQYYELTLTCHDMIQVTSMRIGQIVKLKH